MISFCLPRFCPYQDPDVSFMIIASLTYSWNISTLFRLAKSGFPMKKDDGKCQGSLVSVSECNHLERQPRTKLSSDVVQEMVQGLHYIM